MYRSSLWFRCVSLSSTLPHDRNLSDRRSVLTRTPARWQCTTKCSIEFIVRKAKRAKTKTTWIESQKVQSIPLNILFHRRTSRKNQRKNFSNVEKNKTCEKVQLRTNSEQWINNHVILIIWSHYQIVRRLSPVETVAHFNIYQLQIELQYGSLILTHLQIKPNTACG